MTMPAYDFEYDAPDRESMILLSSLTKEQLRVVVDLMRELTKTNASALYVPQTEDELLARVDHSIQQANRGEYRDSEAFEAELEAELRL